MSNLYNIKSSEQDKKGVTANSLKLTYENNKLSLVKDEDNYIHMYLEAFSVFVLSKNERISNYNETIEKINMFDYYFDYIRLQEAKINLCIKLNNVDSVYENVINKMIMLNDEKESVGQSSYYIDQRVLSNDEGYHFYNIEELNNYLYSGFQLISNELYNTRKVIESEEFLDFLKSFFDEIKKEKLNKEFKEFWNTIRIIGELD